MASDPRGVLYVSSRADYGAGGETYLMRVLAHLDRSRFRPVVVLPREGNLIGELERHGVDWHVVPAEHGWLEQPLLWYRFLAGTRSRIDRLREILADEAIALVHTNSNHRIDGALAAAQSGVHHLFLAHIEYQHDMPIFRRFPLAQPSYARLMGELSSLIVAVSRSVADTYAAQVPADKLRVIHNGLELDALDASAATGGALRTELGLAPDALIVTAVGRLNPDKGFDFLVKAASQVLREKPQACFVIVGGDEVDAHGAALRARVKELGIAERFRFLGFRDNVPGLLRQSDAFVLSSRREGHPFVLLEAMGCGLPAVASRCAGVEETIVEGETGFVVDIGDVTAMGERILALLDDDERRERMGVAARARIEHSFQASGMVQQLMHTYDEVLTTPAPLPGAPGVDLFLNAASETGALGVEVEQLKTRVHELEGRLDPLFNNVLVRALRRLRNVLKSS